VSCVHLGGNDPCVTYANGECRVEKKQRNAKYREEHGDHLKRYEEGRREQRKQYNAERHSRLYPTVLGRARKLVSHAKERAGNLGLPFEIDVPFVVHLLSLGDAISGKAFDLTAGKGRLPMGPSLDQFLPGRGYTRKNTWAIANKWNTMKSDGTLEEMENVLAWMRLVKAGVPLRRTIVHAQFRRVLQNCTPEQLHKSPKHWISETRLVIRKARKPRRKA
jgi:hypothetical protein